MRAKVWRKYDSSGRTWCYTIHDEHGQLVVQGNGFTWEGAMGSVAWWLGPPAHEVPC